MGGKAELVEVCPHGRRGDTVVPQVGDRGVTVTLRELLPVVAEEQPVMDDLRELTPDRTCDALLERFVGTVVGASDDVRDPHLQVVGDRRELVGGGAVRPDECHAVQPERAVGVAHRASLSLGDVVPQPHGLRLARSAAPAPGPTQCRATRDRPRVASSPPSRRRAASVSSIRNVRVPPRASANRRFATAVSALPRCSDPVGLGAKRTRTVTARI